MWMGRRASPGGSRIAAAPLTSLGGVDLLVPCGEAKGQCKAALQKGSSKPWGSEGEDGMRPR